MRIVWPIAALLVLAGTTLGRAQSVYTEGPPPEAVTALDEGKAALAQEEYDDAVGLFNKAIRIAEEEYAEAFLLRGQTYLKKKEYQQASASLQKAIQQKEELEDDQLAQAYNGLGEAFLELGPEGIGAAVQNFGEATQIDYKNKDYLLNLGTTLVKLRGADQAIKTLDRVIAMDDQSAEAYDARGQAHGMLAHDKPEELDLAMADFAKAIELDPDDKKVYYNMGLILLQNDQLEPAVGAFSQSIAKYQAEVARKAPSGAEQGPPVAPSGQEGTATDAAQDGMQPPAGPAAPPPTTDPAQAATEPAAEDEAADEGEADEDEADEEDEGPYVQPYMARALAFTELGKKNAGEMRAKAYQLAVSDVDQALALVPQMPDALLIRGVALRLMNDFEGAIISLTEALKINPQFGEALYRRGIIWFYLGEYDLALSDLKQAGQISPRDARSQVWQGYAHAGKGNYNEAVNAYSRALEHDERFQPALNNRGLAYLRLRQYDKAIGDFNEVLRLEPTNSGAYFKRGIAMEMLGDLDQAVASYEFAVQTDQNNVAAYRRLAELYQQQDQVDLARQTRQEADQAAIRAKEAKQAPPPAETMSTPPTGETAPLSSDLMPFSESGLFPEASQGLDAVGPDLSLPSADLSLPGAETLPSQPAPATDPLIAPPPATDDSNDTSGFDLFN